MAYATFDAFAQDVFQLYGQKRYEEALALMTPVIDQFPDQLWRTRNWQASMLARLCRGDEAIAVLKSAVEADLFYLTSELLEDPDFAALRDRPDFLAVVETSRRLQAEAQAKAKPRRLLARPASGDAPRLLALHGNYDNAADTLPRWQTAAEAGWEVVALQSSQITGSRCFIWDDREKAVAEVVQHHAELSAERPAATVIGGFSMGAATAIWAALSQAIPAQGFVVLGPWLPDAENLRPFLEKRRGSGLKGVIICGELDEPCLKATREVAALMAEFGLPCRTEIIPGLGHTYPADFGVRLTRALEFIAAR